MRKLKILGLGDISTTGIGESLRIPLRHFHDSGHEISQTGLGFNGWADLIDPDMYPWRNRLYNNLGNGSTEERFGQKCLAQLAQHVEPDILVSAYDVWMVAHLAQPHLRLGKESQELLGLDTRCFNHVAYFPLDGALDDGTLPREMDEVIAGFDTPVTYSRFARDVVYRSMGIEIPFIPIAHDPTIYYPGSREEARARLGLPQDKWIIGMIGTNQYRKLFLEFLNACAPIAKRHSDVVIMPWTTWNQQIAGGFDLEHAIYTHDIARQCINPGSACHGMSDYQMADLYRAMDVCVLTTIGEGAGLPPLRSRACGVPALVSANSSNTEFTASEFERVTSHPTFYDNTSNIVRYTTDVAELSSKLEELYQDRSYRDHLGAVAAEEMKQYELANVVPLWDELIRGIIT